MGAIYSSLLALRARLRVLKPPWRHAWVRWSQGLPAARWMSMVGLDRRVLPVRKGKNPLATRPTVSCLLESLLSEPTRMLAVGWAA